MTKFSFSFLCTYEETKDSDRSCFTNSITKFNNRVSQIQHATEFHLAPLVRVDSNKYI